MKENKTARIRFDILDKRLKFQVSGIRYCCIRPIENYTFTLIFHGYFTGSQLFHSKFSSFFAVLPELSIHTRLRQGCYHVLR